MGLEDPTNLHQHARHNAQEAIALARQRAQDFDTQAALVRKTNEALRLAKGQAHLRDDEDEQTEGAPLVDCTYLSASMSSDVVNDNNSGLGGTELPEPELAQWSFDGWPTTDVDGPVEGVPAQRVELVGYTVRTGDQRHPCR